MWAWFLDFEFTKSLLNVQFHAVPLPVYILGANSPPEALCFSGDANDGCEIYTDITYLGGSSKLSENQLLFNVLDCIVQLC